MVDWSKLLIRANRPDTPDMLRCWEWRIGTTIAEESLEIFEKSPSTVRGGDAPRAFAPMEPAIDGRVGEKWEEWIGIRNQSSLIPD
jgi:hypothetical protein